MIDTKILNKFNEIRALIFCNSPQVKQTRTHIVTLDEYGDVDSIAAELTAPEAYFILCEMIRNSPLSVELAVHGPFHSPVIRDKSLPERLLAFMLPQ